MISSTVKVTFDEDDVVAEKAQLIIKAAFPNTTVIYFGYERIVMQVSCGAGINLSNLEKFMAATLTSCGGKEVRV